MPKFIQVTSQKGPVLLAYQRILSVVDYVPPLYMWERVSSFDLGGQHYCAEDNGRCHYKSTVGGGHSSRVLIDRIEYSAAEQAFRQAEEPNARRQHAELHAPYKSKLAYAEGNVHGTYVIKETQAELLAVLNS